MCLYPVCPSVTVMVTVSDQEQMRGVIDLPSLAILVHCVSRTSTPAQSGAEKILTVVSPSSTSAAALTRVLCIPANDIVGNIQNISRV